MKFFSNVLGTFLTEVLIVGLNFVLGILVARLLSVSERGVLALIMLLPVTLAYFADLGVSQAIVYLLGRQKRPLSVVVGVGFVLALALGLFAALLLWLGRDFVLSTVLHDVPAPYFLVLLSLLPLILLDTYGLSVLRAQQRFRAFNLRRLLTPFLLLLGVILLVGGLRWGVLGALVAYVIATLFGLFLTIWLVASHLQERMHFEKALAGEALSFGLKSYLQNLVGHLNYRLDVYLLALFLPPADLAYYAVATSIAEVAWYIPDSVGTVLFPSLTAIQPTKRIHRMTAEVCRHTLFITALASLGILAVGWWMIPFFYGPAYSPAVAPLFLLTPGILAMAVYKVLTRNFTSRHRQLVSVVAASLALVLNVLFNLLLIPRLGIIGAALSSLLSYSASAMVLLLVFHRESGLSYRRVLFIRRSDLERYIDIGRQLRRKLQPGAQPAAVPGNGDLSSQDKQDVRAVSRPAAHPSTEVVQK